MGRLTARRARLRVLAVELALVLLVSAGGLLVVQGLGGPSPRSQQVLDRQLGLAWGRCLAVSRGDWINAC